MEQQQIDLRNKGYYIGILDGSKTLNRYSFVINIAQSFQFPDYYGENMDAFWECINDLNWLAQANYALIISNSELFMSNDTEDNKRHIIDALQEVSEEWANVPNYEGEDEFRKRADFKVIYS